LVPETAISNLSQAGMQIESMLFHFMRDQVKTYSILLIRCLLIAALAISSWTLEAYAQDDAQGDTQAGASSPQVSIGIDGNIRLGKWVPVTIKYPATPPVVPVKYEITARDGDDAPTTYCGDLTVDSNNPGHYQGLVRLGRSYGSAELRLVSATGEVETIKLPFRGEDRIAPAFRSTRALIATIEPTSHFKTSIESYSLIGKQLLRVF